jgi:uncharacterized sodium:solute symporter family permease YidK
MVSDFFSFEHDFFYVFAQLLCCSVFQMLFLGSITCMKLASHPSGGHYF